MIELIVTHQRDDTIHLSLPLYITEEIQLRLQLLLHHLLH